MKIYALSLLLMTPLLLSACAGDKGPPRMCPQVAILRDLERIEDYGNDAIDPSTLVAVSEMKSVEGACAYEENGVDVRFALKVLAEKGPRLGGDHVTLPYFTSIVEPDGKVKSKEIMSAKFEFSSGGKTAALEETLHVFIPLEKDADGSFYRVLLGFQLSDAQLKAAREKRGE